jgi:hypothetical protein
MTVGKLIEELQKFDAELDVMIYTIDQGSSDIEAVEKVKNTVYIGDN